MKKKTAGALLGGVAIGAGLGVLFAPKSGKETRADLKAKIDLDKEKVLKIAKDKAKEIQKSAKDLVSYVKDKGEPVLEEAADAVRQKAIDATKAVLAKLEKAK